MTEPTSAERGSWYASSNPAELFLQLWRVASLWSPADLANFPGPPRTFIEETKSACRTSEGKEAVRKILDLQERDWPQHGSMKAEGRACGLVLGTMHAIDAFCASLHPRSRLVHATIAASSKPPAWMQMVKQDRLSHGSFTETDEYRLVPNGPFARHARGRDASSGEALRDHFAYLCVAPVRCHHDDRPIGIKMIVVSEDKTRGVPASRSIGTERIRFVPLAEDISDLTFEPSKRDGNSFLDVRPAIDTADRLLSALSDGGDVDLAFSPELTVPGEDEDRICAGVRSMGQNAPRLILAGSGLTEQTTPCGRRWNEARILTRGGRVLWRHRKIWPFGMQADKAKSFGLPDPGVGKMLMEDIAAHDELLVADLDGFGRIVIFICQDFQCDPMVERIITTYQPDWVLVPVLDPGVDVAGWAHRRAYALSGKAQARTLVGSSLTMSRLGKHAAKAEPPVGIAIGPAEPVDTRAAPTRAVAVVRTAAGVSPRKGELVWDHAKPTWSKTSLGSDDGTI